MDKLRIMGKLMLSNNSTLNNKLLLTDKWDNSKLMQVHTNKVMLNKVMHKLMQILMANNNTTLMVKQEWAKVQWDREWDKVPYHSQERSRCHTMELLHNPNLMGLPDRRIHQRR